MVGLSPLEAGIMLVPMAVASLVAAAVAPFLAGRFGTRKIMFLGLLIAGIAMVGLLPFLGNLSLVPVIISSTLVGVGSGVLAVSSAVIMIETPPEKAASAAAFEEISYDLGNVIGVAILGSLASIIYRIGLDHDILIASGLDEESFNAAYESFGAAAEIAQKTGVDELLREGMASFSDSIVITSTIGGVVMVFVAIMVFRLIPKNLNITED